MELTLNEKRCLESFTRSGYFAGEYDKDRYPGLNLGDWMDTEFYAGILKCTVNQVKGYIGSLAKKGYIKVLEDDPDDWIGFTEKGWYAIKTILGD